MAANEKHSSDTADKAPESSWKESVGSVLVAILVALTLRAFVVEAFKIPSGSMIPTLAIGDQIFVNKFRYGVRIPFTSTRLVEFEDPQRGEVIVFICPYQPSDDYIKRIAAVGGDELEYRQGILHINGEPQVSLILAPNHLFQPGFLSQLTPLGQYRGRKAQVWSEKTTIAPFF